MLIPLLISFLLPILASAISQSCYAPNGTKLDETFAPCNPKANHSGCCATNRPDGSDLCLSSGLCMATDGIYTGTVWQAGCTDPTGQDAGCPKMCADASSSLDGQDPPQAWNIQTCDYGSYCCRASNNPNSCCTNTTIPRTTTTLGTINLQTTASSPASSTPSTAPPTSSASPFPLLPTILAAALALSVLSLGSTILWMYRRERHQRRLKEHYEAQFGQNFAYARTVVVGADGERDVKGEPEEDLECVDLVGERMEKGLVKGKGDGVGRVYRGSERGRET